MANFHTPLRYPGGKARLGPWLAFTMRANGISGGSYIEPYAGGAGAACFLLLNGYVKNIVLNDLDPAVYAFWHSILNNTSSFIKKAIETPCNLISWETQRHVIKNPECYSLLDLGFACFFLNRTNRSGILKAGVIGGKKQNQKDNIDARYNLAGLIDRIEKISTQRKRISIYNLDALDFIQLSSNFQHKKTITYIDPPYYIKGAQLYRNSYKHQDHEEVADFVKKLEYPWIVSYDDCEEIRKIYNGQRIDQLDITYSAHLSRKYASEVIFYNNIELPISPRTSRRASGFPKSWSDEKGHFSVVR